MIQQWVDEKEGIREQHREGGWGTESKQHQCSAKVFRPSLGDTPRMVPSAERMPCGPYRSACPNRAGACPNGARAKGSQQRTWLAGFALMPQ